MEDPLIKEINNSNIMQRLKGIDQSGAARYYVSDVPPYNRYEHSVGVYKLLKKVNAPLNEQAAGLLHDASHTVFSHVAEFLFNHDCHNDSYQDHIHKWSLSQQGLSSILSRYNLDIDDVLHKKGSFYALEQSLPDLCADRIEYNLHTGLIYGKLTQDEIDEITSCLIYDRGRWYFTNTKQAIKFSRLSLYFTENFWGSSWNWVLYHWFAKALKQAVKIKLLNLQEIHFSSDDEVLNKLNQSNDELIKHYLYNCEHHNKTFKVVDADDGDVLLQPKFRGVDPWVKTSSSYKRLTAIDKDYNQSYTQLKETITTGWYLKLKEVVDYRSPSIISKIAALN